MPDRTWNTRHIETITAKAREERLLRETRRALGPRFSLDHDPDPVVTRAEFERLIQRAVHEYHMKPHVTLRAARDIALEDARRLIEQRGQCGDDA